MACIPWNWRFYDSFWALYTTVLCIKENIEHCQIACIYSCFVYIHWFFWVEVGPWVDFPAVYWGLFSQGRLVPDGNKIVPI